MSSTIPPLIRDLKTQDLPAILRIYQAAFPDEMRADEVSPEDLQKQFQTLMMGNMIPFKVLAWLTRLSWALLVAEVDGQVVGLGGFQGSAGSIEGGPLMVLPEYQRHGIGAALTQVGLTRAARMGITKVRAGSLVTNQASLSNLAKHGFVAYRYRTGYEVALPWMQSVTDTEISIRPAQVNDKEQLRDFEVRAFGEERLEREGSQVEFFCPSWVSQVVRKLLARVTRVPLIAQRAGQIVATAEVSAEAHTPKGRVLLEKDAQSLPEVAELMLLSWAAKWLAQQGKHTMRVYVPGQITPPSFATAENRHCGVYLFRQIEKQ